MTQVQDGRLSIIIDAGAWSNLIGMKFAKAMSEKTKVHQQALGYRRPQQHKLQRALEVAGVGKGSQRCEYESQCPIMLTDSHGKTSRHSLSAPIIEGVENTTLDETGLLGLKTLESKRATLDCGKRILHLPGDGDVEMNLPPGSVSYPLEKVPSGHLALVVDNCEKLMNKTGGIPDTCEPTFEHPRIPQNLQLR